MVNELRELILNHGVPNELLDRYDMVSQLESKNFCKSVVTSSKEETWRLKYLRVEEKAQKLELQAVVNNEKLRLARAAVTKMAAYCRKLRHQIFGDKSERAASSQTAPANPAEPKPDAPKRGKKRGTKGRGRNRDGGEPKPINHDLDDCDKFCKCGDGFDLRDLPGVVSYETHFEEIVVVREHRRRKCIRYCKKCGKTAGVKTAKAPDKLIPKSKYSTEFWRFLIEEKFWLQRPLNRTREKLKWLGATVRLGTITNSLQLLHKRSVFEVIYELILDRSRLAELRHMDDTGWKMFAESAEKHSSRWYMWVSITSDTTVFILDPRRSNEVIAEHLQGASDGIIVCDRHSSFKCFAKNNQGFIIAFCWIHQRRDFKNLQIAHPVHYQWAEGWLNRIDALIAQNKVRLAAITEPEQFKIEDGILRKMIDEMKKAIDAGLADSSLAKEKVAELESLKNHWSGLTVFVERPYVPMSNNEAERALRDAVLGRKSYYGSRALWSGYLTSHLFTIYATLEQNGIDPHQWMGEYLHACAKNNGLPPPGKELQRFLPWNYKSANTQSDAPETQPPEHVSAAPQINISIIPEHAAQPVH